MIKKTILTLGLLVAIENVSFASTDTTTTFKDPSATQTNEYGDSYFEREAIISTKNFKVNNFWNNFKTDGEGQSNYTTISRSGLFKITTSATSACTLDGTLEAEGCSGQKPFLLNDEVLTNPMSGTTDEYEVVFTPATDYTNNDYNAFYPLDILRDAQYYKDTSISTNTDATRKTGFFGFITNAFDSLFNKVVGISFFGQKDIADIKYTAPSKAAVDRRQRYIANIIAGIEKKYRVTKEANDKTATPINAPILNTPPSLLDYNEALKTTTTSQCKFMFLSLSSDGAMCRIMSGFGMNAWMPFFNKTKTTQIQSNYILADTENALLAMTGKIDNVPYLKDVAGTNDEKLSFLSKLLKPMKTMYTTMKVMMFGTKKKDLVEKPVERVYNFSEDDAMTMTFPITNDGSQIDDFASFKLLKIRSVYGDEMNSCTVKKNWGFASPTKWGPEIFVANGSISKKSPNSTIFKKEIWNSDEWLTWCQKATNRKGMFDYLFDWSTGGVLNPLNWMKGTFSAFISLFTGSYEITNFTNTVKRGLILDLKKVDLNPISRRNTREIQILKINSPKVVK
jgi:hypothetical protein